MEVHKNVPRYRDSAAHGAKISDQACAIELGDEAVDGAVVDALRGASAQTRPSGETRKRNADPAVGRRKEPAPRLVGPEAAGLEHRPQAGGRNRRGEVAALNNEILGKIAKPFFHAVVDPERRYRLPDDEVLDLVRSAGGEILVSDNVPVHFLLTRDGLFARRFDLNAHADGSTVKVKGPLRHNEKQGTKLASAHVRSLGPEYEYHPEEITVSGLETL